ncbi:MAG: 50S ribosomal protein L25 [Dehalococcoidales bacterium]|nr:50S ribosomal protein L25 [Dehalococcoidales bacterium]
MAEKIELKVDERMVLGKKVKYLRHKGVVPVHLFGHDIESQSLQGEEAAVGKVIAQAGKTRLIDLKVGKSEKSHTVMLKEVQRDPVKGSLVHVDLYQVNMAEKIRVEVPVVITGESPALKARENMLQHSLGSLSIECLPDKMPDRIEVDISVIKEVEEAIRVKDLQLEDVNVLNDPDLMIVKVSARHVEVLEEAKPAAAEGAEPKAEAEAETKAEEKA